MAAIDLVTKQQVLDAMEVPSGTSKFDTLVPELITQASRAIMSSVKREFLPKSSDITRRFPVRGYQVRLSPYDLRAASAVAWDPDGSNSALVLGIDYELQPMNAPRGVYRMLQFANFRSLVSTGSVYFGYSTVAITGDWGWPSVPEDVQQACITTVRSWLRGSIATLVNSGDVGAPDQQADVGGSYALPPAVRRMLSTYRDGGSFFA